MEIVIWSHVFMAAFYILYFAVIITTVFVVILDNRNPVKTMAWILVLFFLPVAGLVFYLFSGGAPAGSISSAGKGMPV